MGMRQVRDLRWTCHRPHVGAQMDPKNGKKISKGTPYQTVKDPSMESWQVRDALDLSMALSANGRVEDNPNLPGLAQVPRLPDRVLITLGMILQTILIVPVFSPLPALACIFDHAADLPRHCCGLFVSTRLLTAVLCSASAQLFVHLGGAGGDGEVPPLSLTNDIDLLTLYRSLRSPPPPSEAF